MTMNAPLLPEEVLARAEAALRTAGRAEKPSPSALRTALEALHEAERSRRVAPRLRRPVIRRPTQIAAAIAVAAMAVFGVSDWGRSPTAAFAQVAKKLHDAQTLIYRMRLTSPALTEPEATKVFVKGSGQSRMESERGPVTVNDAGLGKTVTFDPTTKTALAVELKRVKPPGEAREPDGDDVIEHLRNLTKAEAKTTGQKDIEGRKAQGYRVEEGQFQWLIWVDIQTNDPLMAEISLPHGVKVTLSDFELNQPLDDQLFALEPPRGYAVQNATLELPAPEEALARMLRTYAEAADKAFPPNIDDWGAIGTRIREASMAGGKQAPRRQPSPELMEFVANVAVAAKFFTPLKQGYAYCPEGAKLGDAKQMLFWYRPSEAGDYRVLYADLHWADVAAGQIPEQDAK